MVPRIDKEIWWKLSQEQRNAIQEHNRRNRSPNMNTIPTKDTRQVKSSIEVEKTKEESDERSKRKEIKNDQEETKMTITHL